MVRAKRTQKARIQMDMARIQMERTQEEKSVILYNIY